LNDDEEPLTSRRTRGEPGKRFDDDATFVSGTRSSVDNEPPADFFVFTKKKAGSNNHFTRFHTDHLIRPPAVSAGIRDLIPLMALLPNCSQAELQSLPSCEAVKMLATFINNNQAESG
jgi:hypothetical protein